MTEEDYAGVKSADVGGSSRLLLIAVAMIAAGLGLWNLDDRGDNGRNAAKPHLILADQNR